MTTELWSNLSNSHISWEKAFPGNYNNANWATSSILKDRRNIENHLIQWFSIRSNFAPTTYLYADIFWLTTSGCSQHLEGKDHGY